VNAVAAGLFLLLLSGCGGGADAGTPDEASRAGVDTLVVSADPALRQLAAEILPDLATRSGLSLRRPVRIERRSRAALEGYLRVKLDEELPPAKARNLTAAYHRLGMMPDTVDLRELLLSVYLEQVAGFYDPDSTALFVLDDQPAESLRPLLLHELVHAVQDQWADLDALTGPEVGNDRRMAAQAAIEGHATLVMLEDMTEQLRGGEVDLASIPDMGNQLRPALEAVRDQYPALAAAPRVIQEGLLFPYLEGAGFVLELWQARPERVAPFGDDLPASTEQVLRPERFFSDPPDLPTDVVVSAGSGRVLLDDVLGQAETAILLAEAVGASPDAAHGWDGDRWILVELTDGGPPLLAWASVWDDVASRDGVEAHLRPALDRFPGGAELEPLEVDGRPVLLLMVGGLVEVEIALSGGGAP
jgi:hypothetical protein